MDSVVRNVVDPKFENLDSKLIQLQKQINDLKTNMDTIKKNQNDIIQILKMINNKFDLTIE